MNINLIILAAGRGTRIGGRKPLSKVLDRELVKAVSENVLDNPRYPIAGKIVVVGDCASEIAQLLPSHSLVFQEMANGSGGALEACLPHLVPGEASLVVNCDMPLIRPVTIAHFIERFLAVKPSLLLASARLHDPKGYGRIVRRRHQVCAICEEAKLKGRRRRIKEVNAGLYLFANDDLIKYLPFLPFHKDKGEKYLTDIVEIFYRRHRPISYFTINDPSEILGVNDRRQLAEATEIARTRIIDEFCQKGVNIPFPSSTIIGSYATIKAGAIIEPATQIWGASLIDEGAVIGSGSFLFDSHIGPRSQIICSHITDTTIGADCQIGPYARLRGHCQVGDNCRIGNFVELKNTVFGSKSKSAHLSYLGDARVGQEVNIGCGVVTANYDGRKKHQSVIEDRAFVGCNANLIAPVTIGVGSFVAAGSTVTLDVPPKALAIARARQVNKENYQIKEK